MLEQPYEDVPGGARGSERALADRLGAAAPSTRELEDSVFGDLDTEHGIYGVGWWYPHPGTARRILISDYLWAAIRSVEANLVEAKLHELAMLDAIDREDNLLARSVDYDSNGNVTINAPARTNGLDSLPPAQRDLHIVGFFRATGSALDCLAAATIGVLGLKLKIQRASLSPILSGQRSKILKHDPDVTGLREGTFRTLDAAEHWRTGWLAWTLATRNTLVHRARPMTLVSLVPESTLDRPGHPIPYQRTTHRVPLPRDPERSDIESMRESRTPVLAEDVRTTMRCVFDLTKRVCNDVGSELLQAWETRRTTPSLIHQPREQWPDVPSAPPSDFAGCAPGSEPYDPGLYQSGSVIITRMRAASLMNDSPAQWDHFD